MIFRLLILYSVISTGTSVDLSADLTNTRRRCQVGYMTEKQSWVNGTGVLLTKETDPKGTLDLSGIKNPVPELKQAVTSSKSKQFVKYLSLAQCKLSKIPPVFTFRYSNGSFLHETVEYVSFFGNVFVGPSSSGDLYTSTLNATFPREVNLEDQRRAQVANVWSAGFTGITFPKLKELDLRKCSIQILGEDLFRGMVKLEALYLGENEISFIDFTAFLGLRNLKHLDMSRNHALDQNSGPRAINSNTYYVFQELTSLEFLDLTHTKMSKQNLGMILSLGPSLKGLSLCDTGLLGLPRNLFYNTSLEFLDISSIILGINNPLRGLEDKLKFLFANEAGLSTLGIIANFSKLQLLQVARNEISNFPEDVARSLKNLHVLDLDKNRLTAWFEKTFALMPKLKYVSLEDNNINLITEAMIQDLANVDYVAMSNNFMVCNCHAKEFFLKAFVNEMKHKDNLLQIPNNTFTKIVYDFYNDLLSTRHRLQMNCDEECVAEVGDSGRFRLIDYYPGSYICLLVSESRSVNFADVMSCDGETREYDISLDQGRRKLLLLLLIPCFMLPMTFLFVFRRHIRYFIITMRNSAMLSLINNKELIESDTILNYDVFVSYCNEDRGWVLEHLLPHMEAECSVSACLHERDFQVGLSILENIVSCMDRSKSIMLIISQRFLLSQWCQFEMHLAQHRLLETRREDLILILLEDIPRRLRPNTLHYLMLTKTYILWPKDESDRHVFWKRLKKALITQKSKYISEHSSLA